MKYIRLNQAEKILLFFRKNVGYASTCNAVGQTAGYFLGNAVFLSLESADFANTFFRSKEDQKPYGLIDLSGRDLKIYKSTK